MESQKPGALGGGKLRCWEESTGCELEARVSSFCLKEIFY